MPGQPIVIEKFKTYTNSSSGFTYLYALGKMVLAGGEQIEFKCNLGNVDRSLSGRKEAELSIAPWQGRNDRPITFRYHP